MSDGSIDSGVIGCEIGGFIATALLHELRVSYFSFTNFPEIDVKMKGDGFNITLKVEGLESSPFFLDFRVVKKRSSLSEKKCR